jgi:hypothetical protein
MQELAAADKKAAEAKGPTKPAPIPAKPAVKPVVQTKPNVNPRLKGKR